MRIALVVALAACGSSSSSSPSPSPDPEPPAPREPEDLASLVAPGVIAIARMPVDASPVMAAVAQLVDPEPPCWKKLREAIAVTYQIIAGKESYFAFEGKLPRAEVLACVREALPGVQVGDGALAQIDVPVGTVYAGWRGSFVVVGTRAQVDTALGAHDAAETRAWRAQLAREPIGMVGAWGTTRGIADLFGVPATRYTFAVDRASREQRSFAGRLVATYATEADAERVVGKIRAGEIIAALAEPRIVAAIKRMPVTRSGATVTATFDEHLFEGLDLDALNKWLVDATLALGTL